LAQKEELNQAISVLLQRRKKIEAAVGLRKKALASAKKEFKEVRRKKKKLGNPILETEWDRLS
jgi:hypothetical protein